MPAAPPTHHSIGDVLALLRDEFPDITISKIRFLESQGLIDPERTPSGYRKFYPADIERLRWILHQQKAHFLPLKVIKSRLEQLELGGGALVGATEPPPRATPAARGRKPGGRPRRNPKPAPVPLENDLADDLGVAPSGASLTRAELARAAGLSDAQVAELEAYGLLTPATETGDRVLFDEDGLAIARLAAGCAKRGIEARHLRMYRTFAEREAALYGQTVVALVRQRNPEARARVREELAELARLGRGLRTAFLRQATRELLDE